MPDDEEESAASATLTLTDGMAPTKCTVAALFTNDIPVGSEVWLFSLGDGVYEVMNVHNQPFTDNGAGPNGGVILTDAALIQRSLTPCAALRYHYFLPHPDNRTAHWKFARVPVSGSASAETGRWITESGVPYHSTPTAPESSFTRNRGLLEYSNSDVTSLPWSRVTKRVALATLSEAGRATLAAADSSGGAPPARITDAEIEVKLGLTVVAILKANPSAEVALGHIRAKMNVAVPVCATYEDCLVQIRRRYRGPVGAAVVSSGPSPAPAPAPAAARTRPAAVLSVSVDYTEEESCTVYATNQRSGSGDYELTLRELQEIASGCDDMDEFVSAVADALQQKAYDDPPDTDVDDTNYGGSDNHSTESSDATADHSVVRRSLEALFTTYPDLNPESEAPEEEEDESADDEEE